MPDDTTTEPTARTGNPAYDAVYAYIRSLGDHLPPDPVHRNAIIWRAVQAALDAKHAPAPGLRERIAKAVDEADGHSCAYQEGTDVGEITDAVLAVVQPVIDEAREMARRERERAGNAFRRAERAERRIAEALAVAEVIESNGIRWAADSIRTALTPPAPADQTRSTT